MIGKENAVQVIDFMLKNSCLEFTELESNLVALMILSLNYNLCGSQDIGSNTGNAEASLFVKFASWPALHYFRIDQSQQAAAWIIFPLMSMHNDHSPIHPDLRCCQAYAAFCVHGFGHVFDQAQGIFIDFLDSLALFAETFVWVKDYATGGHGCNE